MGSTYSVRIFRLVILDYLSRRYDNFGKFPVGETKNNLTIYDFFGK